MNGEDHAALWIRSVRRSTPASIRNYSRCRIDDAMSTRNAMSPHGRVDWFTATPYMRSYLKSTCRYSSIPATLQPQ